MQTKITEYFQAETSKPPQPTAPLNYKPRPTLRRKVTPHPDLWQPKRMPFERRATIATAPFEPRHEHVKVVRRAIDAEPPILPASFGKHVAVHDRTVDLESQAPVISAKAGRVVPFFGQLPDNWQLGVTIGVGIGLVFQLIQTGVNSSLKTGQADILAKLSG